MATLKERLEEVMAAMGWQHADLVRVSRQSSSVVSQWLGKGSKQIKSIGKHEAAEYLEQASGFAALWIAKGQGPKRVPPPLPPVVVASAGEMDPPWLDAASVLRQLQRVLQTLSPEAREPFADVLAGWAKAGGEGDRVPALLALLSLPRKQPHAA